MQVPFQIESSKRMLRGILHIPNNIPDPCNVVIMCYGMNGNRVDNNRISKDFGVVCENNELIFCRFDFAGLGVSDGEFYEIDMQTKVNDCIEVINFVKGCIGKENINLSLIGFSDGIRLMAYLFPKIKVYKHIFWSPLITVEKEYVDSRIGKRMVKEPSTGTVVFPFKGIFINSKHLRQQMQNEIELLLPYFSSSFIIFGGDDPAVIRVFKDFMNKYSIVADNIKFIDGADHLYSRNEWKNRLFELTVDYLKGELDE